MVELPERIAMDPGTLSGTPVIKGTATPVEAILDQLALGNSEAELMASHPDVRIEDIRDCLYFASQVVSEYRSLPDRASIPLPDRIGVDPAIVFGKPRVEHTRLAVELMLEMLGAGETEADMLDTYPNLTREDLRACIALGATMVRVYRPASIAT